MCLEPFYRAFRFRLFEWHKAIYYTELGRAWDRPDDAIHFRKIAGKIVVWSARAFPAAMRSAGTIDSAGNYTAPSMGPSASITITATDGSASGAAGTNSGKSASAQVFFVATGAVATTVNPQVALYTIAPPDDASVTVQFGQTTNYGLTTWTQPTPTGGGAVGMFVAGMLANTTYHMQATVKFASGLTFTDMDHTFTTQSLTAGSASEAHRHDHSLE